MFNDKYYEDSNVEDEEFDIETNKGIDLKLLKD